MDTIVNTNESEEVPLTIQHNREFGYNIYGNYNLVKFSQMQKFTEFTLQNRGIDEEHVNKIYDSIKANITLPIPPIELISYMAPNALDGDKIYVGNGQHRYMAYKKLYEKDNIDMDVMCLFYDANNENEMEKIIKTMNSGKPVESMFGFRERNDFIKKIENTYRNVFSQSENHHHYRINRIKLRDHLDRVGIFNDTTTASNIFEKLEKYNEEVRKTFEHTKSLHERELYNKIKHYHEFYCLMYKDYEWVNKFKNYIRGQMPKAPESTVTKEVIIEYKPVGKEEIKEVMVCGNYNDWMPEKMSYDKESKSFKVIKKLKLGIHEYKFVIKDVYVLHPELEKFRNNDGYENHLLLIK